ncbi:RNA ligase [Neisseria sp.]|uniref:RNA ligase n=1 Tax=Neisseria sp. TaxID=192066 RepID=UPI0035A07355
MQKFILIRGHQGSGKSTFAEEKINGFRRQYPDAEIVHIENDKEMTDGNGVYRWSGEALAAAQEKGRVMMKNAFKQGQKQPERDILVVNSNTNQKSSACIQLLQMAKKHGFETEVYRLHNFYPNRHGVCENDVLAAYVKLNHNRLRDEIHVEAVQPISAEQRAAAEEMAQFTTRRPAFDETQQTFVTEEYLRLGRRNFTIKQSKLFPELRVLKYARSVFYENRFDDALLEMRGLVMDAHGKIIIRPFKKVFNYSERVAENSKYPIDISDDHRVTAVVKVNGFLGCCTYVKLPEGHPSAGAAFDGQVLYSTTGSLDSDFAKMVKTHCSPYEKLFKQYPNTTFLFEITDENDVHVIRERFGETLIGAIDTATGRQFSERELDETAAAFNAGNFSDGLKLVRPETVENITFGELKALLKNVEHEGFMVFDADTGGMLFKLKSPYYLISKFLGRSNEANIGRKLDKRYVDEEYYPLLDHIRAHRDAFNAMGELEKIAFIQAFLSAL